MNVSELRGYVRSQLDVDDEELPDTLLNVYLQDAFERTLSMDNRWPRNEQTFQVSKVPGTQAITLPETLNIPTIMSVTVPDQGYRLAIINHENAEDTYIPYTATGYTAVNQCSIWAGKMWLWPRPNIDQTVDLEIRAYAQPEWSNEAGTIPDLDPRLHIALCYYAIALAYAQQEDEVLEGVYMARWNRDVTQTIKTIMEPVHNHPLVLHGGSRLGGVPSWVIVPPTT